MSIYVCLYEAPRSFANPPVNGRFMKPPLCHMIVFHFKDQSLGQLISLRTMYINRFSRLLVLVIWVL